MEDNACCGNCYHNKDCENYSKKHNDWVCGLYMSGGEHKTDQIDLFSYDNEIDYKVGSKEWRKERYYQLINQYTFEELEDYMSKTLNSDNDYDYYSHQVAIDICHSYYYEKFKEKYPKILFGKRNIFYLGE